MKKNSEIRRQNKLRGEKRAKLYEQSEKRKLEQLQSISTPELKEQKEIHVGLKIFPMEPVSDVLNRMLPPEEFLVSK